MSKKTWKEESFDTLKRLPEVIFLTIAINFIYSPLPKLGDWNAVVSLITLYWGILSIMKRIEKERKYYG